MSNYLKNILAWALLCLPLLSWAIEGTDTAQRGTPIAQYLDAEGHLNMPKGYAGSLNPAGYRMVTGAIQAPKFVPSTGAEQPEGNDDWTAFGGLQNGCNGPIQTIVQQSNGNIVVGGTFTDCADIPANNIAVYTPASNSWAGLGTGSGNGVAGNVNALVIYGGDLYVSGEFTRAGGVSANRIARWNGSDWASLGTGTGNGVNSTVLALAVSGSDLYVGGYFTQAGGIVANGVARWNGSGWTSLSISGGGVDGFVSALSVSGNDLYVGGQFTQAGDVVANNVARWNGGSWASLGTGSGNGVDNSVYTLAVSGSDLYVGGEFAQAGGVPATRGVARWNGSSWASLGTGNGVTDTVYALTVSGSDLYVGGNFTQAGGIPANYVARWNGSSWTSLGNGVNSSVYTLAVFGSDLYVSGGFIQAGDAPANRVARWNGSSWASLGNGSGNGVNSRVNALAVSGSDLYVGGGFTQTGGVAANYVAHWNGSSWASLGSVSSNGVSGDFFHTVNALAVFGGDLYVGGSFTHAGGVAANGVARWDGSSWTSLGTGSGNGVNNAVLALAVSGSDLYVGGFFTQAGGVAANGVARWNGSSWASLGTGSGNGVSLDFFNFVSALAVSGSDLYVGGQFTEAGVSANNVARWNGTSWASLSTDSGNGVNSRVTDFAVSGSDLYVSGSFNGAAGIPANNVARWNGSSWSSLGSGNGVGGGILTTVNAMTVSGSDLYVGGQFITAGGVPANNVARWNGSSWSSLSADTGNGVNNFVYALAASNGSMQEVRNYMKPVLSRAHAAARGETYEWKGRQKDPRYEFRTLTIRARLGALITPALEPQLIALGVPKSAEETQAIRTAQWAAREKTRSRAQEGRYAQTRDKYTAQAAERAQKAHELREAGLTQAAIGARLGITQARVAQLLKYKCAPLLV